MNYPPLYLPENAAKLPRSGFVQRTGNLAGFSENVFNKADILANWPNVPTAIYTRSS